MQGSRYVPFLAAALVALLGLEGCDRPPAAPDSIANAVGREDGTVVLPLEIRFDKGTFIVVPFGDPRIPAGTPTAPCPVGEANPDLGLPAGFPNGGGVVVIEGTGHARHLGRFDVVGTRCAVQFFPPTDPPFVNFDLRSTLTAADGSQLFIRGDFATTPFTPPAVGRPIFEIVGGTGRFEGASGSVPQSAGGDVTCSDSSGLCLEGTFMGGSTQGEIVLPRP